ncbi:hypothetical protein BGY98DRAFT_1047299 [Russula aff. rugulosa BPL654]|nr:hypothetical protein BGY98DRAFT_1047299 [Russula aff. rugulosa BPL654]
MSKTNKHLPPRLRARYGLVAKLHWFPAPNGPDQSRVEFSKRKPVFYMHSLAVARGYSTTSISGMVRTRWSIRTTMVRRFGPRAPDSCVPHRQRRVE